MKTTSKFLIVWGVTAACLILSVKATYAVVAGQVQFVIGNVQITTMGGVTRPLIKGDAVNEGDAVSTALASSAQIKMKDGGFVAIRPDTRMKFDKFVFNGKQDGDERSFFSLFKGGFRAVTGLIGKANKQHYKITTPAATIGIRGTDHETFVVPVGNASVPAGAYSKVNVGETTLTTNLGTVTVLPNQMGFSSGMNDVPKLAPINTNIFTVSATPTKSIKESKQENSEQQDGKDEKTARKDEKGEPVAAGKQRDKQSDDKQESKQDTATAGSGRGSGKPDAGDAAPIRNVAADDAPASHIAERSSLPAPAGTPTLAVRQVLVPIELENEATGKKLNATTQRQTVGGVTTALPAIGTAGSTTLISQGALAGGPFAAYAPNLVALEDISAWSSLADTANLVYVTGGTGNVSASGALSSYTYQDIAGGAGYTYTSTTTGGTATSANAPSFATTGIQYGAWNGYTGHASTETRQLGGTGNGKGTNSWMYGAEGYLDAQYKIVSAAPFITVTGAMAGTFIYQKDGGSAPYSQDSGLTGTLTSASFTANFVNMQISAALRITMPGNDNWGADVANQPFSLAAGQFNFFTNPGGIGNNMTLTRGVGGAVLAACSTCGGNVAGVFTGQNFAGAILSYSLYDRTALGSSDVRGNVALTRNFAGNTNVTNGPPASTGNIVVADASGGGFISTHPATSTTTTGNVLTSYGIGGNTTSVICPSCTSTPAGQVATSGIYYGNWTAGSFTKTSSQITTGSPPIYWITGPEAGPLYLPQALIATASYALDAGMVSNANGVAGKVLGTTALTVDFARQTVGVNMDISIADTAATPVMHTWNAKTTALLQGGQGIGGETFRAGYGCNGCGSLTVLVDGVAATGTGIGGSGNIGGQFTGSGLTGAIISFNLYGVTNSVFENISGVAAFSGVAQNVATAHRYVSISFYDQLGVAPMLGFYANNAARVTQDAAGNLTKFDMEQLTNGGVGSFTLANASGTLTDQGSDPVSGVSWGRWAGGSVNVTDRVTGVVTAKAIGVGSLHWITEPVATGAVTLPISGTYTYINSGGTRPTDILGNIGTLNSATLTANFTAQTVNMGVNATVGGATLNAAATNAPIIQKTAFYASTAEPVASTSYLTVTCTGTCNGTTTGGTVIGKFTGAGATGAVMSYGLQHGAVVVNGVAGFHR